MEQWVIYKHTSMKSGKSYIGQTKRTMEVRWNEHVQTANRGSQLHFHRAISLYGSTNWEHEILADSIDTIEEANQLERYYIKKEDTFDNGYNLDMGGGGTYFGTDAITHKFVHFEHGIREVTALELATEFDITVRGVYRVITQNRDSYAGWCLYSVVGDTPYNFKKTTTVTAFTHDTHGVIYCTPKELVTTYNLILDKVMMVVNYKRKHHNDWYLLNQEEG